MKTNDQRPAVKTGGFFGSPRGEDDRFRRIEVTSLSLRRPGTGGGILKFPSFVLARRVCRGRVYFWEVGA